ncbi:MAG: MurR/RpiR family transcriptional regulator [Roseovarius sp.]
MSDPAPSGPKATHKTVREAIRSHYATLTASERKFAQALLDNYPAAGLASITIAATNADVSTPTLARLVQKLGFKGYPQFQQVLLSELEAKASGPTQRRDQWASEVPAAHLLNRFATAIGNNIQQTLANLDSAQFDAATGLLADPERRLYVVGGRISRALADYAFTHFQAVRRRITHMTSSSATWPHYVLDMAEGDVLLLFDMRRYETNLLRLAELASARGVHVILMTDQWESPAAAHATHTFHCWTQIPSAWDSNTSTMMLLEGLIAAVQEANWPETRQRYEQLDAIFDAARLFEK